MKTNKGFTLIELLVVIAIIGILASVVLASLNTARDKGSDAAIKSSVNNARAQAELYYDDSLNSYAGVCAADSSVSPAGLADFLIGAESSGSPAALCNDAAGAWAFEAQLKASDDYYYCVDSTGKATTSATSKTTGTACP